ncbi:unnamed protein product [Darwinula stevensoni]|nr:unnamed protein product [Darwinula stevensoni]CAG0881455.1 unnamed protein product [Darwinula stevensoni]
MNEDTGVDYISPWKIGEAIQGLGGLGVVCESQSNHFKKGNIVTNIGLKWPWELFFLMEESNLTHVDDNVIKKAIHLPLSCIGLVGLTALLGVRVMGQISPNGTENVVVSSAAGATGSLAAQIAKLDGARRVIGLTGSDPKCEILVKELGLHGAINYKTENILARIQELCPEGVDVYFDNVGGTISDLIIRQMNPGGRIVLCGQISTYNQDVPYPPPISEDTQAILVERNIKRDRFLVLNYIEKFPQAIHELTQLVMEDKIKVCLLVFIGVAFIFEAYLSLMFYHQMMFF